MHAQLALKFLAVVSIVSSPFRFTHKMFTIKKNTNCEKLKHAMIKLDGIDHDKFMRVYVVRGKKRKKKSPTTLQFDCSMLHCILHMYPVELIISKRRRRRKKQNPTLMIAIKFLPESFLESKSNMRILSQPV